MPRVQANKSMTSETFGTCDHCSVQFPYALIHNGFNDSAYAYCDSCGTVGFISAWQSDIPKEANFRAQGPISPETAKLLAPCSCGGRFRLMAAPRCPGDHHRTGSDSTSRIVPRKRGTPPFSSQSHDAIARSTQLFGFSNAGYLRLLFQLTDA